MMILNYGLNLFKEKTFLRKNIMSSMILLIIFKVMLQVLGKVNTTQYKDIIKLLKMWLKITSIKLK